MIFIPLLPWEKGFGDEVKIPLKDGVRGLRTGDNWMKNSELYIN
jgi:hypothetical protein